MLPGLGVGQLVRARPDAHGSCDSEARGRASPAPSPPRRLRRVVGGRLRRLAGRGDGAPGRERAVARGGHAPAADGHRSADAATTTGSRHRLAGGGRGVRHERRPRTTTITGSLAGLRGAARDARRRRSPRRRAARHGCRPPAGRSRRCARSVGAGFPTDVGHATTLRARGRPALDRGRGAPRRRSPATPFRFERRAMGSPLRLTVVDAAPGGGPPDERLAERAWRLVSDEFEAAEQAMSRFRDSSDLTAVNRAAGSGSRDRVDRRLVRALVAADRAGRSHRAGSSTPGSWPTSSASATTGSISADACPADRSGTDGRPVGATLAARRSARRRPLRWTPRSTSAGSARAWRCAGRGSAQAGRRAGRWRRRRRVAAARRAARGRRRPRGRRAGARVRALDRRDRGSGRWRRAVAVVAVRARGGGHLVGAGPSLAYRRRPAGPPSRRPADGRAGRGRAARGHRRRPDPAWSEVWSKSLFLYGAAGSPTRPGRAVWRRGGSATTAASR